MPITEMVEVFAARITCVGHIWAACEIISSFSVGISGTVPMTKSTCGSGSMDVVGCRRAMAESAETFLAKGLSDERHQPTSDPEKTQPEYQMRRVPYGSRTCEGQSPVPGCLAGVNECDGHSCSSHSNQCNSKSLNQWSAQVACLPGSPRMEGGLTIWAAPITPGPFTSWCRSGC
jgi:hypothetical protein